MTTGKKKDCNECVCKDGQWACTELVCTQKCSPGDTRKGKCGNTCKCIEGEWACTKMACVKECKCGEKCTSEAGKAGYCQENGQCGAQMPRTCCRPGTQKRGDKCNSCTCSSTGQWRCTNKDCGGNGICNSTTTKAITKDCNNCTCLNNELACTVSTCPSYDCSVSSTSDSREKRGWCCRTEKKRCPKPKKLLKTLVKLAKKIEDQETLRQLIDSFCLAVSKKLLVDISFLTCTGQQEVNMTAGGNGRRLLETGSNIILEATLDDEEEAHLAPVEDILEVATMEFVDTVMDLENAPQISSDDIKIVTNDNDDDDGDKTNGAYGLDLFLPTLLAVVVGNVLTM